MLALVDGSLQLLAHDVDAGVIRELEVIHAGHDRRQVTVGVVVVIGSLPHDGELRGQRLQAPDGKPRRAGDKLDELTLLDNVVIAQDFEEEFDGLTLVGVAVVWSAALC